MGDSMGRILIASYARKAIKDISDSPERGIRNIVDLASQFTKGRFQKELFRYAQELLENPESGYYKLIPYVLNNVDHDTVLTFGMNLGYNSCTKGAEVIREKEREENHNIPWCITMDVNADVFYKRTQRYEHLICQGISCGIYTYFVRSNSADCVLKLCRRFPECAFVLMCSAGDITEDLLASASDIKNIMYAVEYSPLARTACDMLTARHCLYSVFYIYSEADVENILNDSMVKQIEKLHPVFTALTGRRDCSDESKQKVYNYICRSRRSQLFSTVLWDYVFDNRYVDSIISDDYCTVMFDSEGDLFQGRTDQPVKYNFFDTDLHTILYSAFPK